eukprot:m.165227 g.165227  ORF g.165227 m.165227 type:complete len:293 (-) comp16422_c0_seq3:503-1381(-)
MGLSLVRSSKSFNGWKARRATGCNDTFEKLQALSIDHQFTFPNKLSLTKIDINPKFLSESMSRVVICYLCTQPSHTLHNLAKVNVHLTRNLDTKLSKMVGISELSYDRSCTQEGLGWHAAHIQAISSYDQVYLSCEETSKEQQRLYFKGVFQRRLCTQTYNPSWLHHSRFAALPNNLASMSATLAPTPAAPAEDTKPPAPAPITTRSYSFGSGSTQSAGWTLERSAKLCTSKGASWLAVSRSSVAWRSFDRSYSSAKSSSSIEELPFNPPINSAHEDAFSAGRPWFSSLVKR